VGATWKRILHCYSDWQTIYGNEEVIRKNKKEALELLEEALKNREEEVSYVEKDGDWNNFKEDENFKNILKKYS
jgi:hypothetical protein